jgi:hypothetical protein
MKLKNFATFLITLTLVSCIAAPIQVPTIAPSQTSTFLSPSPTITPKPTLTKTPFSTKTPTLIPTSTFAPMPSERPSYDKISGMYKLQRGSGECNLKVVFEPTVPSYEISFELFCNRGAPSYNGGYAMGKILMVDNIAVYSPRIFPDSVCDIVFQFNGNKVKVTQLGMDFDCGFGHAVYVDGIYTLVDIKAPTLNSLEWGCMGWLELDSPCLQPTPTP